METTPFDLNQTIQRWRENLGQSPAMNREHLDELESHLRDSIARLEPRGLSAEEAFLIATTRIGKPVALEKEFGKINAPSVWIDRMLWMLIGVQVWGLVSGFISSISSGAISLGMIGLNFDFAAHGRVLPVFLFALVRVLAIPGSLALCWWLIVRKGQGWGFRLERLLHRPAALTLFCILLGLAWLAVSTVGYGSTVLLMKLADMRTFGEVTVSIQYANMLGWIIQVVTLLVLTLVLARRRTRLSRE